MADVDDRLAHAMRMMGKTYYYPTTKYGRREPTREGVLTWFSHASVRTRACAEGTVVAVMMHSWDDTVLVELECPSRSDQDGATYQVAPSELFSTREVARRHSAEKLGV